MNNNEKRALALDLLKSLLWRPYIWGGDDPIIGLDCSGLMVEVLQGVGVLPYPGDWTAQGLWDFFASKRVDGPAPGRLVFWRQAGADRVTHVEMCLTDEISVGASGGGRSTRTVQDAIRQNAFIKPRPINGRGHIKGFADPFL